MQTTRRRIGGTAGIGGEPAIYQRSGRVVCEMQHIRNIVYDEQDMAEMLKRIKAGRTNE